MNKTNGTLDALIGESLRISQEREDDLQSLRLALKDNNMQEIKKYSARLCGIPEHQQHAA